MSSIKEEKINPRLCAWRVDNQIGRTIYAVQPERAHYQTDHDKMIGTMDTPALAVAACIAHNRLIGVWPPIWSQRGTERGNEKTWTREWAHWL